MNRHRFFIGLTLLQAVVLALLLLHGKERVADLSGRQLPALKTTVSALQLTDLSLWTEARYTRHPSQADRFTPFQDFPSALEHFPAGSIMAPVSAEPAPP
jgi:hypothetical protein